ncbi:MAG TPA: putative toxin-antitoxin system toxin component, PIN family [Candidatus Methylomirabilis sp.]|nr:putative toxin-antitoxin system toxin component, PIN family [Candidatus Methylomirabilis sp.]
MRVVFDTNVFISAFVIPGSQAEHAFTLARQRRCELCTSVPILTETAGRLRAKFDQDEDDIKDALRQIIRSARVVAPSRRVAVVADDPDNRILECPVKARADLVVTGDRHLLKLKRFEGIAIVRLADFLRLFPGNDRRPGACGSSTPS